MSLIQLRKAIKENKIVYGSEKTLKNLKLGKTHTVFLAGNCPEELRKKIKSYLVEIIELEETSDEIALLCKRPHSLIVLSY